MSKQWIAESIQPHSNKNQYGYHWRLTKFNEEECFYATGFGLQRLFVFPKLNLVIALSQQHYQTMAEGDVATNELVEDIMSVVNK